jgi:hypothetical protein
MKKVTVRITTKELEIKELSLPLCRALSYVQVMKQKGFACDIIQ